MALIWAAGSSPAFAFTQGNFVNVTLEGCRNDGTITLPIDGKFVCPDAAYTTGNLGKGWNELDLVPHRLTTSLGNQTNATTDYNVYVAGDGITSGKVGWDVVSVPVVNSAKSDASCTVSAGSQLTLGDASNPFGGGTDTVIYRELTIHQDKGTTCVFDYYQRLALGSHLYPGSSLQSYLAVQENLSGSKKTISIPVKEILPQSLAKDMTATQGSDYAWSVTKGSTAASLSFGDICSPTAPKTLPISITVTWTKSAANPTAITVTTHVYATNPSAREITTNVTDRIRSGDAVLDIATTPLEGVVVPANTTMLVLTHKIDVPDGTLAINDVASATYIDTVTGIPIPGETTATANALPQVTVTDATVSINDLERITGADLTYSVATPASGSFDPPYVAGTPTAGDVSWSAIGVNESGSVTFNKTIYLARPVVTSGTLTDTATAKETNSEGSSSAGPFDVAITSTSTSTLTINKSYSKLTLGSGEKLVFSFKITRTSDSSYVEKSITFSGGGATSGSIVMSGLPADAYVIDELPTVFYPNGCSDSGCSLVVPVTDPVSSTATVDLTTKDGVPTCSGSATFSNEPVATAFPTAQVEKITLPDSSGTWAFTLKRPDGSTAATLNSVVANAGFINFGVALSVEGTYTVIETEQTGWDLISGVPNDGTNTKVCSFTVKFPQDLMDKTFSCTFTNYQRGKAKVVKTANGASPPSGLDFTFQLRQGATTLSDGTTLETVAASSSNGWTIEFSTSLVANATYQMCELVMPGWNTSLGTYGTLFVPNSQIPPSLPNPNVNNMTVCVNFTVTPGDTKTLDFNVDNSPPPGGRALTIGFWKNWASCSNSKGGQKPVLDQTLAKAPVIGDPTDGHNTLPGVVLSATSGSMYLFGPTYYLVTHGSASTPNVAPDCAKAVNLLDKSTINTGKKMASDPAFNLAAQLLAAELNHVAGAYSNPTVVTTINNAVLLLGKYKFNGITHTTISAADATLMNNYAKMLDDYNNNR